MKLTAATLPYLFLPMLAWGQAGVVQSGAVVVGDFACWLDNGIVNDCGVSSLTLSLPVISNGSVLGNATGIDAQAQGTTLSNMLDTLGSAAWGNVAYRGAAGWVVLAPGTSGQFLETLGVNANPTWANAPGQVYTGSSSITLTGSAFSITAPVSVPNGGTGLTVGTSGGILGYTATGTLASSALLTHRGVMLGGGAGATPYALSSLGTSGQVLTSAGAASDPSWVSPAAGTVTTINTGHCLTGGPINATGTVAAVDAASGVCGVVTPDTNSAHFLNGVGAWATPAGTTPVPLIGTTGTIGGSSLAAGACLTGTVAIVGATTAMAVATNPVTYPGDVAYWKAYVSSAGTVTAASCMVTAGTPVATVFQIRVVP